MHAQRLLFSLVGSGFSNVDPSIGQAGIGDDEDDDGEAVAPPCAAATADRPSQYGGAPRHAHVSGPIYAS